MTMTLLEIMRTSSVIPVIAIDDPEHAVPLARALVAGGIRVLEVTLRTKHGLEAIRAMSAVPGAIVGVGTLTRPEEFAQARDAGAVFGVSPGLTSARAAASACSTPSTARCRTSPSARRAASRKRRRRSSWRARTSPAWAVHG